MHSVVMYRQGGMMEEVNFGYNSKMEGYPNLSSDIPELGETPAKKGADL